MNTDSPTGLIKILMNSRLYAYLPISLSAVLFTLAGCAVNTPGQNGPSGNSADLTPRAAASAPESSLLRASKRDLKTVGETEDASVSRGPSTSVDTMLGSGVTFRSMASDSPRVSAPGTGQPVSLSFENGDVREVVRNILGDLLGENYIIDPRVQGTITMKTAKPVPASDAIVLLETILRANNIGMAKEGAYWRVLPLNEVIKGVARPVTANAPGITAIRGASVVIYPVKHIGAKEMLRVLEPFAKDAQSLRVDELRNLLFISGPQSDTDRLIEIADMFDVSLLAGMSFSLVTLRSADVTLVMADYEKIVGGAALNPFAGLLRVVPIARMNAVMLISPQREVILNAQQWIERLDKGGDAGGGARLYVYEVQFTQAEKLQATLQQALSGRANPAAAASVAPGQTPNTVFSPVSPLPGQSIVTAGNTAATPVAVARPPVSGVAAAGGQAIGLARNATVIADKDRNALLIVATPSEYAAIEIALKKLDTAPKMIAIEVQIAQVALTGDLKFGLSGMFSGKPDSPINRLTSEGGVGSINSATTTAGAIVSGFNYTWQGAAAKAMLNTLQNKGQSRTIASPTMMTLDNQKVSFTNGTQISVQTQSVAGSAVTGATNSFQYINTGLTIVLTPRVSGDNVFLEIQQQNSNAVARTDGNPNPDIVQNSQQTSVMVANGDTMLLGGLFLDSSSNGSSGLPLLSTIPLVGGLFGTQSWNSNRSELVMLVTPRIMATTQDTRGVVDELRKKMQSIENFAPTASTRELPTSADDRDILNGGSLRIAPSVNKPEPTTGGAP